MSEKDKDNNKNTSHPFGNPNIPNNPYNTNDSKNTGNPSKDTDNSSHPYHIKDKNPTDRVDENSKRDKVVLGDDVYEKPERTEEKKLPVVTEKESRKNYVEVDKVDAEVVREKKGRGVFDNLKMYGIGLAVVALIALFANAIQSMLFRSPDSLIFLGNTGVLTPPVGVILMGIGILAVIFAAVSFVHKNSRYSGKQKGSILLVGLLLVVVGLTSFFKYVDFRENTILDRTFISSRAHTYFDVTEVRANFDAARPEGSRLIYSFVLPGSRVYDINVSSGNMEALKAIDTKIIATAKRSIDNFALQEIVRIGMYTEDEALRLFFPR